ncbi:MAG TPA: hypothetical protein VM686_39575 [Polyangiaceae bacterium]|nr:hypothetical protein [Polyangiaceae bacterium]
MVSSTRQTTRRRSIRAGNQGRSRKRTEAKGSTPKFPIQPPGYDQNAADAKKKA